jgi:hypothetical protein
VAPPGVTAAKSDPVQANSDLVQKCRAVGNDDTLRGYDPAIHGQIRAAYHRAFPQAPAPAQPVLQNQTNIRCMDHRLLVCFTGANLPCGKMNQAPDNQGADAFCRSAPDAAVVPMVATGHDTIYAYRCVAGQAKIADRIIKDLDQRGFARQLWTPLSTP